MDESVIRRKVAEARVARVGTLDERGSVHLVPVVYVVDGDTWYSPSDPGSRPVKRLRNVLADPRAGHGHRHPGVGGVVLFLMTAPRAGWSAWSAGPGRPSGQSGRSNVTKSRPGPL
jgi:hypothetical protein